MKRIKKYMIFLVVLFTGIIEGCNKQNQFLDEKENIALTIPTSLNDFQNLLNNEYAFNENDPALGALTGEDYYVADNYWLSASTNQRNAYIFASQVYDAIGNYNDWIQPYNAIYISNVVLDGISGLQNNGVSSTVLNNLMGRALFYRSWNLYNLLQNYALPYDSISSSKDLGIPLKLSSDFNIKVGRSTVEDCYSQIIKDLQSATLLLPQSTAYNTQPTITAANALLARIYLAMGKYVPALEYSNIVLSQDSVLTDFNDLDSTSLSIIGNTYSNEDIFHHTLNNYSFLMYGNTSIDSLLYRQYSDNDLRKSLYFIKRASSNSLTFKGSYDLNRYPYSGLATDEMFLINAECNARTGNIQLAMDRLNALLVKRWRSGTFKPIIANTSQDALYAILIERRKELIWRGLRWTDLRRLNKEERYKQSLVHIVNGVSYKLDPNSPLYAMPIPETEIQLNGITQNDR